MNTQLCNHCWLTKIQKAEVAQYLCSSPRPFALIKTQTICVAYIGKTHLQLTTAIMNEAIKPTCQNFLFFV